MPQLLPKHCRIDPQLLCNLVRKFVADYAAGNTLYVGQKMIQRFHLSFGVANRELCLGALDQVLKIRLGVAQSVHISLFTFTTNK